MQRLEVSGAVRPIYGSLGVKWLRDRIASTRVGEGATGINYEDCTVPLFDRAKR